MQSPEKEVVSSPEYNWNFRGYTSISYGAITSLQFDHEVELLWVGDFFGYMNSFTSQLPVAESVTWHSYSSFRVSKEAVVSTVSIPGEHESVMASINANTLRVHKRGGFPCFSKDIKNIGLKKLTLLAADRGKRLFVGSEALGIVPLEMSPTGLNFLINNTPVLPSQPPSSVQTPTMMDGSIYPSPGSPVESGNITPVSSPIGMLGTPAVANPAAHQFTIEGSSGSTCVKVVPNLGLVCGTSSGDICVRDTESFRMIHRIPPGSVGGKILDFDCGENNNVLFSSSVIDRSSSILRMFDVRNLGRGPMKTCTISGGSAFQILQMPNSEQQRALICCPSRFHVVDTLEEKPIYTSMEMDDGVFTTASLTQNGKHVALGSDKGILYLFSCGSTGQTAFCNTDAQVNPPQAKLPTFKQSWSNREVAIDHGFNSAAPEEELASNWPPSNYMIRSVSTKYRQLPVSILSQVRTGYPMMNSLGLTRSDCYLEDPKDTLHNVIPNPYPFNMCLKDDPVRAAQILLELRKAKRSISKARNTTGYYAKQESSLQVCYTTQGHFSWGEVNMSKDTIGLDNSLPESWMNPLLLCLYHVYPPHYPVRRAIMYHICKKTLCVTCELAFLFTNMTIQQNAIHAAMAVNSPVLPAPIIAPTNLYRTMRQIPEFVAEGISQPVKGRDAAVARMHAVQKKFLQLIEKDLKAREARWILPPHTLPIDYGNTIAAFFGTEISFTKTQIAPQFHWEVPACATKVDEGLQHLLKKLESFNGEQAQIKRLPPILVLLLNPEHGHLLPPGNLRFSRQNEEYNYLLNCKMLHLADDTDDVGHFVNHLRAPNGEFFIMNDYYVSPTATEDVLEAHIPALTPHSTVVAYYALQDFKPPRYGSRGIQEERLNTYEVVGSLLLDEQTANTGTSTGDFFAQQVQVNPPALSPSYSPLKSLIEVSPGDILAWDAEYVAPQWGNEHLRDEPEYIRRQLKTFMFLARVSCILSKKRGEEKMIIDDYVATTEPVLDYVTQYSGIAEGDLDPAVSRQNLSALKSVYLKLRALMDRGVIFLGHGLTQDFRVLGLAVPASQIIDTLELFYRKGTRRLSLRYLAYHVLGERVQEAESGHDSIEDARTCLRLYRQYQELVEQELFEKTMDHLLITGAETGWFIPGEGGSPGNRTPPPGTPSPSRSPPPSMKTQDGASPEVVDPTKQQTTGEGATSPSQKKELPVEQEKKVDLEKQEGQENSPSHLENKGRYNREPFVEDE